jgi:hypothetical protein
MMNSRISGLNWEFKVKGQKDICDLLGSETKKVSGDFQLTQKRIIQSILS